MAVHFTQSLSMAIINADFSHGSAATFVGCGGIFNDNIIANVLPSLSVKEF